LPPPLPRPHLGSYDRLSRSDSYSTLGGYAVGTSLVSNVRMRPVMERNEDSINPQTSTGRILLILRHGPPVCQFELGGSSVGPYGGSGHAREDGVVDGGNERTWVSCHGAPASVLIV